MSLNTGLVRLFAFTVIQMSSGEPLELMLFTVTVFEVVVIAVLLLLNLTWAAPCSIVYLPFVLRGVRGVGG